MSGIKVQFNPEEVNDLAIFNGHKAMVAELTNNTLRRDMQVMAEQLGAVIRERDEHVSKIGRLELIIEGLRLDLENCGAQTPERRVPPLLPAGGVDEESAQKPAGSQDEVALTGSMGG